MQVSLRVLMMAKSAIRHNMKEDLPNIRQKTCIIWGENDKVTPPEVGREFHQEIPNSVSKIAPGIDVRGAGGYVQGANTVTRKGRYRWDLRFIPPFRKLPKMPLKLLQLCLDGTEKANYSITKQRSSIKKDLMSLVSEGSRNSTMASRIGYLIKKLDQETAWRAAVHINNKCCKPPLPDRELERTFQSILCRGRSEVN